MEWWSTESTPDTITVAGGGNGTNKTVNLVSPITVSLSSPVGQSQPISGSATVTTPSFPAGSGVQGSGQYTLVETDASVVTSTGMMYGLSHFQVTGTAQGAPVPSTLQGQPVTGEVYYHPSHGIVSASSPELGSLDLTESSDCGSVDSSGYRTIRKVGVVDASSSFDLDTYTCAGNQFDADKNTHAAMLLELRWLDETNAKTDTQPPPTVEFGTSIGYFPNMMTESPKSIFHPEENSQGFKYWYSYVNQAAKNEPGDNSTTYHITVTGNSGLASAVRVTARIHYKVLQ